METRQEYCGFVIEARPEELRDGLGWTQSYVIKINYGDRIEDRCFDSDRRFPTRDEATAACISAARDIIDRSQGKTGRSTIERDLSATWDEAENLRPTIQGDIDTITGDGTLRYTKDKRRKRLDELDGEPE